MPTKYIKYDIKCSISSVYDCQNTIDSLDHFLDELAKNIINPEPIINDIKNGIITHIDFSKCVLANKGGYAWINHPYSNKLFNNIEIFTARPLIEFSDNKISFKIINPYTHMYISIDPSYEGIFCIDIRRIKNNIIRAYTPSGNKLFDIEDRPYSSEEFINLVKLHIDKNKKEKINNIEEKIPLIGKIYKIVKEKYPKISIIHNQAFDPPKAISAQFHHTKMYIGLSGSDIVIQFNNIHTTIYSLANIGDPEIDPIKIISETIDKAQQFENTLKNYTQ